MAERKVVSNDGNRTKKSTHKKAQEEVSSSKNKVLKKNTTRKDQKKETLNEKVTTLKNQKIVKKNKVDENKDDKNHNNRQNVDKKVSKFLFFKRKEKKNNVIQSSILRKNKKQRSKNKKELCLTMDIFDILIVVIVTTICSCVITGLVLNYQYKKNNPFYSHTFSSNSKIGDFIKIYTEVLDNFYEEVDEKGLVDSAINGMVEFLEDNYSIYMNKEDSESLTESLEGSYEGIGVIAYGNLIYSVIPNSPAYKAGLKEGDIITKINDTIIDDTNFNTVANLIGACDGSIHFVVRRNEEEVTFEIEKSTVVMRVVEGQILKKSNKNIGYIKLSDFSTNSYEQFKNTLIELEEEGFESLIIDLRGNTGGYLNKAADISSMFLEKGKVIYSLENKSGITEYTDKTNESRSYSIVVLINESTASAAEILSVALKDSYEALLVGKKSYGKGKVQSLIYNEDSVVKYTSAKWLRPNGDCIDTIGVQPDYEVNNVIKENIIYDKQLEKAIELLTS